MAMPSSVNDPMVTQFAKVFGLTNAPVILGYQAAGYAPIQCHINAKIHAIKNGGKRIHGWAIWQTPTEFIGEHHSVWCDGHDNLIDVTPPRFGTQTMFIRDDAADIYTMPGGFVLKSDRLLQPVPHFRNVTGTPFPEWAVSEQAPNLVGYCATVGMNVADLATDPKFG